MTHRERRIREIERQINTLKLLIEKGEGDVEWYKSQRQQEQLKLDKLQSQ